MKSKVGAAIFAVVFALGFGAGGVFSLYTLAGQLNGWWQARSWQAVPATVVSAELKTSHDGSRTTYRTLARYRYVVSGHTYEGDRINLGGPSSNAWQQEQYARLQGALSDQRPIGIWVDPADPTHSVVNRDLRPRELVFLLPFATLFPMVSIGALWVLVRVFRTPNDDASWRAQRAVATQREIRSDARTSARLTWFFAICWNLISFPLAFVSMPEHGRLGMWLIVLLFPLVGLLLMWMAAAQTLRLRRSGETTIRLSPTEPRLGESFTVYVTYARGAPAGEYLFTLMCEEVDTRGEDTSYRTKWKQERAVQRDGTYATVTFSPPAHLPPSEREVSVFHRWRVLLDMPDGKDEQAFDVTLSAGDKDQAPASDTEAAIDSDIGDVIARPVPPSIATILEERSGLKISYATDPAHMAVPAGFFGLFAFGIGAFLILGTGAGLMPKVMGVVFAAVGGAILLAGVYARTHRRIVEISNDRVVVENHWLLRASRRECSVSDVRAVTTRINGSSTAGSRRYDQYEIKAVLSNGGDISLASGIRDAGIALTLARLLRKHLGLAPGGKRVAQGGAGLSLPDAATPAERAKAARVVKAIKAGVTVLGALLLLAFLWDAFGAMFFDTRPAQSADSKGASLRRDGMASLSNADRALFRAIEQPATVEAVAAALANGAHVDARNELGATPLMSAATGGRGEIVALLLDSGADANLFESHGWSAAHFAAHRGNVEALRALHRHDSDLDLRNPGNRGETPLMIAACYGQLEAIRVLIELGADPRATDRQGENVYGWARYFKKTAAMELLKEYQ